ncbi:MAG: glycosyltransferase family 2 protein [Candidatus Woesearchaeota archaeon]
MRSKSLPSVAIIIPTYNRAKLLRRAIESVLQQDYSNIVSIIVTDDNSTDNTEEIVKKYMEKDSRIVYIKNKKYEKGPAGNKNNGIDYVEHIVKSELFAILDDDDYLLKDAISSMVKIYLKYEKNYSLVIAEVATEKGINLSIRKEDKEIFTYEEFIKGSISGEHFWLIKTEILKGRRYNDDCWGGEFILLTKLVKESDVLYLRKIVRIYEVEGNRVTLKMFDRADRQFLNYKYYIEEFKKDLKEIAPERLSYLYFVGAIFSKLSKDSEKYWKKYLFNSLKYDKTVINFFKVLMIFFLPEFILKKILVFYFNLKNGER